MKLKVNIGAGNRIQSFPGVSVHWLSTNTLRGRWWTTPTYTRQFGLTVGVLVEYELCYG